MTTLKRQPAIALLILLMLAAAWLLAPAAGASSPPLFVVTVGSAYVRSAPSFDAPPVASIFQNQIFVISARQTGDLWLRLEVRGLAGDAWSPVQYGQIQGSLADAPMLAAVVDRPAATATASTSAAPGAPTAATPQAWFTLQVKSVYGRGQPSLTGPLAASLFRGQTYPVSGRLADNSWLRLDYSGAPEVWVLPSYGLVTGSLDGVPILSLPAPADSPVAPTSASPLSTADLIQVGSRAREIYQHGLQLGNNPRVFSRIGDCNSAVPDFLGVFDNPQAYQLGGAYADLQGAIANFAGSFARPSQAAVAGFSAAAVLDPAWADPRVCRAGESPLACEYRLARPSFALISLGTNSTWQRPADYEQDLRVIIQYSIDRGVVPILSTKADNLEGDDYMNAIVQRLAAEYNIPLLQFAAVARRLPDSGLEADRYHLTWGPPVFDDPQNLNFGWQWRNLTGLQALDAVWRAVR